MPSKAHDFIVGCLTRKIRALGYQIVAMDGKWMTISDTRYDLPKRVIRHRPDIIGYNINKGLCIGEAKTETDLTTSRTKEQLVDFSSVPDCVLILGIPKSSENKIIDLLNSLNLNNRAITCLFIPEVFL